MSSFERDKTVGDQDLLLFYHRKGDGGFLSGGWDPCDRQVVAEASQALLLLLGWQLDGLPLLMLQEPGSRFLYNQHVLPEIRGAGRVRIFFFVLNLN